jgi:enterochelin esterase-like enzyme
MRVPSYFPLNNRYQMQTGLWLRIIGCGCALSAIVACAQSQGNHAPATLTESPTIAKLSDELNRGNLQAVDDFWKKIQDHAPLVEPIAGDANNSLVTFVWRDDDKTHRVNVVGGPAPTDGESIKWLSRLNDTDVWYRTEIMPDDARFIYIFQVNRPEMLPTNSAVRNKLLLDLGRTDPLNPKAGGSMASMLELPNAPEQPWLERNPTSPEGQLSEELSVDSKILKQTRKFKMYLPSVDDTKENTNWLLVMFDGEFCAAHYPTILDNLIAAKKIPKVATLFVYQTEQRDKELACGQPFVDFLVDELLPQVREKYHVGASASYVIIGGFSRGGLMASYCAWKHPETFGNVLSLSGSYWWSPDGDDGLFVPPAEPGWLTREYAGAPRLAIRFFLSAGRFENTYPVSLLAENRRFRDVLLAKDYTVQYREYSSGHATLCWYVPLVDGLVYLTQTPSATSDN